MNAVSVIDAGIALWLTGIDQNQLLMPSTKAAYKSAVKRAFNAGIDLHDPIDLRTYAEQLPTSAAHHLRGGIKSYVKAMTIKLQANVTPDTYQQTAAAIMRLNALSAVIEPKRTARGTTAHTWLKRLQVADLLSRPNTETSPGTRDYMLLALMVGCGLRRDEAIRAAWSDLTRQGDRVVLSVFGKGAKNRIVPINPALVQRLESWRPSDGQGTIIRRIRRGGLPSADGITARTVNRIVGRYGELIGVPQLQPHDLRRTFAQIGLRNGVPIEQVSILLGHSSIVITQKYLDIDLNMTETISDFVPF